MDTEEQGGCFDEVNGYIKNSGLDELLSEEEDFVKHLCAQGFAPGKITILFRENMWLRRIIRKWLEMGWSLQDLALLVSNHFYGGEINLVSLEEQVDNKRSEPDPTEDNDPSP